MYPDVGFIAFFLQTLPCPATFSHATYRNRPLLDGSERNILKHFRFQFLLRVSPVLSLMHARITNHKKTFSRATTSRPAFTRLPLLFCEILLSFLPFLPSAAEALGALILSVFERGRQGSFLERGGRFETWSGNRIGWRDCLVRLFRDHVLVVESGYGCVAGWVGWRCTYRKFYECAFKMVLMNSSIVTLSTL
jgi:hypothetical protein